MALFGKLCQKGKIIPPICRDVWDQPFVQLQSMSLEPNALCQTRWQRHQQLLMRQAPEMGIALLNEANTSAPLAFHKGHWERTTKPLGELISCTPGRQIAAERSQSIGQHARALVIWGMGLGYLYLQLRPWLAADRTRQLIFCESELMSATAFLHMPWAEQMLTDPQVHVRAHFSGEREKGAMREIAWLSLLLPLEFLFSEFTDPKSPHLQRRAAIAEQMVRGAHGQFDQIASELLRFSEPFYANFYINFLRQTHIANARFLKGAFGDLTALICGAGPSLKEQIIDLKKAAGRFLLLAGGSAVNSLIAQSIEPHFGLAIDPNPLQEQRLRAHVGYSVPYLFRRRLFASGLDAICGPQILVDGGAGYPLVDWLDEQVLVDGDTAHSIDEGHNVMHFAIDLARHMGIEKSVLCGMDLAYDQSEGYSPGVLDGHVGNSAISGHLCCAEPLIQYPNDEGQMVTTHWKWVEEARWIGEYNARSPNNALGNATPTGLGIKGVKRVELSALITSDDPQRDLFNRVWLELQRAIAKEEKRKIDPQTLLKPIWQSLVCIESLCQQMETIDGEKNLIEWVKGGQADLLLAKLEQELAYLLLLRFADQMHKVILERSLRPMAGIDQPFEHWPDDLRAVAICRRLKFLQKGCAFHRRWWNRAQNIAMGNPKNQLSGSAEQSAPHLFVKNRAKGEAMMKLRERLALFGKRSKMGQELIICEPALGIDIKIAANSAFISHGKKISNKEFNDFKKNSLTLCRERKNSKGEVEEVWLQSGQQRQGQSLLLYPDGSIKGESFYKNHQLHGPSRYFLPDGSMTSELFFANGERQGYQRQFYADGSLYSAGGYRDDKRLGTHWSFHPDGQLKSKIGYCEDQIDGLVQIFHPDGRPARKTRFKMGNRHGWDRQWSKEGKRAFEALYELGRPCQTARRWHNNGQLAERLTYLEPGGRVETVQFSDQGHRICRGKYLDSIHYLLKTWDERGQLSDEQTLIWRDSALYPE